VRIAAFCVFAALLVTGGCARSGEAVSHPPATLRLVAQDDPRTLNPLLMLSGSESALASLAFDTLLEVNSRNVFVPSLATVVPAVVNGGISKDGKRYTFRLRRGVRWHDGAAFTSRDVEFTIRTILSRRNSVSNRAGYDDILSVQTPSPLTVIVRLRRPFAPFLADVGAGYPIVPAHLLEKSTNLLLDPFGSHPIGTGPYRFVEWERGERLVYAANPHYLRTPKIARIEVELLSNLDAQNNAISRGDVDFAGVQSSQYALLRSRPNIVATTEPLNDFFGLALNTQRAILVDARVRRALVMAIDRAAIVRDNTFGAGTVAYADLPLFMWTNRVPADPARYDTSAARKLLDAADWHVGSDGVRERNGIRFHLDGVAFAESATGRNIDLQVEQMFKNVGVDISWKYVSYQLYFATKADRGTLATGNYDIADFPFNGGGVDVGNNELYACDKNDQRGFNAARYCNPAMETLQARSLAELDPKVRLKYVGKIERLAASDAPYIFLYYIPRRLVWTPSLHRGGAGFLNSGLGSAM
jgi:peptide/nickel transport system substrate-binding protein